MSEGQKIALIGFLLLVFAPYSNRAHAQSSGPISNDRSDQTLEIAPRVAPAAPPTEMPAPSPNAPAMDSEAAQSSSGAATPPQPSAPRPYLGISVQTIYSNDWSRHGGPAAGVTGLEVVSVDQNSPAAIAGLHGRTGMNSVGESSATVGALVPPLGLLMDPLLKKAGALGQGGDLIVAIDDQRVTGDLDLQAKLERLNPGDVIYLTVVRTGTGSSRKILKLPVKLGDASRVAPTSAANGPVPPAPDTSMRHP